MAFVHDNLRGHVLWSPTERVHNPPCGHAFFTQPKVSQHHMTPAVQQDVLWFEVSGRRTDRSVGLVYEDFLLLIFLYVPLILHLLLFSL